MRAFLENAARRIWPGLASLPESQRLAVTGDIWGTLWAAPFMIAGLIWLVRATDWSLLTHEWPLLLALTLLLVPINRFSYFVLAEISPGKITDILSSLDGVVSWTAGLILGPTGLWVGVLGVLGRVVKEFFSQRGVYYRWNLARNETQNLAEAGLIRLLALQWMVGMGGKIPMPGFEWISVAAALVATLFVFVATNLLSIPLLIYYSKMLHWVDPSVRPGSFVRFYLKSTTLLGAGAPFAVLGAGLYTAHGLPVFLFFMGGLVTVSVLANQLSVSAFNSRQQTRLLEGLESLARDLLLAPAETDTLMEQVRQKIESGHLHLPGQVEVRLFPDREVVRWSPDFQGAPAEAWEWLKSNPATHLFTRGIDLPWGYSNSHRCTALVDITDVEKGQLIGGIYYSVSTRGYIKPALFRIYVAGLQNLADQVALAVRRAQVYQALTQHQRVEQELHLAGEIQGSLLPGRFPEVDRWRLSALLVSARDTSGDYFDFIPIQDGRVGVVVADVADKGVGAALYMALSRAYLRSQALVGDPSPDPVLNMLNKRILEDTDTGLFVTLFYGLVAPGDPVLRYGNAGHPPPLLVRSDPARPVELLTRTGMAVGVESACCYEEAEVTLFPGDFVVIYSDGITEASNAVGEPYAIPRLIDEVDSLRGLSPLDVRTRLMESFHKFAGEEQEDDITLVILQYTG